MSTEQIKPERLGRRASMRWDATIPLLLTYQDAALRDTCVGGWTTSITKGGLSCRLSAPLPKHVKLVKVDVLNSDHTYRHTAKNVWHRAEPNHYEMQLREIDP